MFTRKKDVNMLTLNKAATAFPPTFFTLISQFFHTDTFAMFLLSDYKVSLPLRLHFGADNSVMKRSEV